MKKELDEQLVKDFPLLYRDRYCDFRESAMAWGFPDDGWEPLIRELSSKLEPLIKKYIENNTIDNCTCLCEKYKHTFNNGFYDKCCNYKLMPYRFQTSYMSLWLWSNAKRNKYGVLKILGYFWISKVYIPTVRVLNALCKFLYNYFGVSKTVYCTCEQYQPNYPRAAQVKQKYGKLRFYLENGTKEMYKIVREYENKSANVCESCGAPGKLTKGIPIKTVCESCKV